ncbi:hypothetical protein BJ170DRAFT_717127 [Xylariales sp. AK1849]|nr:hypothetical protein BJ170DRAFT_717127 [Xylariales sp. AK1849]
MQSSPAQNGALYAGAKSRYDDFQALHIVQTGVAHYIGSFFPWHRRFLALFEQDLQTTCGYEGGIPYWNWTLDTPDMLASPLFDLVYGFGGNGAWVENTTTSPPEWQIAVNIPGRSGGGCTLDGPFAKRSVNWILEAEDFWTLDHRTQGIALGVINMSIHAAGHQSLGGNVGEFTNMYSSPGDQLF